MVESLWMFFKNVWKYILGPDKVLQSSDIVSIGSDKNLYRAKIENVQIKRFVISNSKKQRGSQAA